MENSDQQKKSELQKLLIDLRACRMELNKISTELGIGTGDSHTTDIFSAIPPELKRRIMRSTELIHEHLKQLESIHKQPTSGTSSEDD